MPPIRKLQVRVRDARKWEEVPFRTWVTIKAWGEKKLEVQAGLELITFLQKTTAQELDLYAVVPDHPYSTVLVGTITRNPTEINRWTGTNEWDLTETPEGLELIYGKEEEGRNPAVGPDASEPGRRE